MPVFVPSLLSPLCADAGHVMLLCADAVNVVPVFVLLRSDTKRPVVALAFVAKDIVATITATGY